MSKKYIEQKRGGKYDTYPPPFCIFKHLYKSSIDDSIQNLTAPQLARDYAQDPFRYTSR